MFLCFFVLCRELLCLSCRELLRLSFREMLCLFCREHLCSSCRALKYIWVILCLRCFCVLLRIASFFILPLLFFIRCIKSRFINIISNITSHFIFQHFPFGRDDNLSAWHSWRISVMDAREFDWESQLRFYWMREPDELVMRQCTGTFGYGYEYMGLNGRLVITPLTDRIYLTLTQVAASFHTTWLL